VQGDRIRHDKFLDGGGLDPFDGRTGQNGMGRAHRDFQGAFLPEGRGGLHHGSGRVDHVVQQDDALPLDVADDVHDLGLIGPLASFVDDGQRGTQALAESPGPFHASRIRRDDDQVSSLVVVLDVVQQNRRRVEVVDGDVEESLDLPRVQVHGKDAVRSSRGDQIGDELGGDGRPGSHLAVLSRVTVVGDDRRDPVRRCPFHRIDHDQQFHYGEVDGRARGLNDEDIHAAHVFVDFDARLSVAEGCDIGLAERHAEIPADLLRQSDVGVPAEYPDSFEHGCPTGS